MDYAIQCQEYVKLFYINEDETEYKKSSFASENVKYSQNSNLPFEKQLDLWMKRKWNNRSQLLLFKRLPQIYLDLGLNNIPLTVSSSKLDRIINKFGKYSGNYHNLGVATVKRIPTYIARPLSILESSTVRNSIVVVTKLTDRDGKTIIVSMAIDGHGHIETINNNNNNIEVVRIPANVMTSAYGRNNYDIWIRQNKDKIIYDKYNGIIKKRVNGEWLQLPEGVNSTGYNISQNDDNVKYDISINSNMFNK